MDPSCEQMVPPTSTVTEQSISQLDIDAILDVLMRERGLDFRLYRRTTIGRRIGQRLAALRASSGDAYLQLLQREPDELDKLVRHLTLKVTSFFRNKEVYDLMHKTVLPELVRQDVIRAWSAGCATGEEAYSIAIILAEALGPAGSLHHASIVASDIDSAALAFARAGYYAVASLGDVPPLVIDRWFRISADGRWRVSDELRERVTFVLHSLIDALSPPCVAEGGFDLVLCRNVLIYFQRPLQDRVFDLLHRSLRPGGYLVLGEAESLPANFDRLYRCLDRRARVYSKTL